MTEQSAGKGPPSAIMLVFSNLVHILLVAPVIYILVLAFSNYHFFSWHPICMSLGVGLLVTEAVFSISGEAYLASKISRMNRVTLHWILHTLGLGLMLIGFLIIVVNKVTNNRSHFVTPHSVLGLVSIIFALLTASFGIVTNNSRWLYPRFRPVLLKILHAFGGIVVTILLLATLITGTYTKWWPGSDTGRSLVFSSFFIAGFFILLKPILGAVSRSRVVFGPPPATT
ncbi:Cytochrome b561 domain-containing protein 2 [Habropoda laboriosa]|uniref:ascorbate ferrireductase (transmembrane) n=1 Tax=Habropoda laboriosa TaxID=597456 RepID=A0A0L7QM98_9HYME|nr:PREDICTED: cytochrome b561 domain-containing protein 2-like [Habropoda laboriosa]XP_017796118.1 PREDICTED: cytochrome b561 domain-containing protein 2-like [Habropoda laboriosa]KOC59669.1 Cytochrome b561 domain-containing protein 2 [Habropoda laboriosa]